MKKFAVPFLVLLFAAPVAADPFALGAADEGRVEKVLDSMSLSEKIGQLVQFSGRGGPSGASKWDQDLAQGSVGSFLNVSGARQVNAIQRRALAGGAKIPLLFGLDVIHGYATTFPIPLAEACSFDLGLAEQTAEAAAIEAAAAGLRWTFAPMVDIARDPRWGRVMEGAGEDPLLGAAFAAARVRGFQRKRRLAACLKHFVGYGAVESGREYNSVDMNPRKLWEVYYLPFEAGLDAGAATVMSSFNTVNDVPLAADPQGLRGILKDTFGFKGFVVSDWDSVGELVVHGVAADSRDAAREGILAGVDMDMVGSHYLDKLADLVKDGTVPEADVTDAARRVLRVKAWLGLLDHPMSDETLEARVTLSRSHRRLALKAARESCVLLKNDGVLPLAANPGRVALIGPLGDDQTDLLGDWAAKGDPKNVVSLLQGLKNRLGAGAEIEAVRGCGFSDQRRGGFAEALSAAARADVVVMALGEPKTMSGEAHSRTDIGLPGEQRELLEAVLAVGKPTVLVLFNGRPLALQWEQDHAPAILEAWFPGVEGGNAVADLLLGRADPQGRLAMTFPRVVGQIPIYYAVLPTGRPASAERWSSKWIDSPVTPLYPFGYGLDYTSFEYTTPEAQARVAAGKPFEVRVRVRNSGKRAGIETAQLYVRGPVAGVSRPLRELKAFQKLSLAPGQSKNLVFKIQPRDLAYYDRNLRFGFDPGRFEIFVGGDSTADHKAVVEVVGDAHFYELPGQRPALAQEQVMASAPFEVHGGGSGSVDGGGTGPTGPTGPTGN